jgi:uncharacterized membrane protein YedE/YeeE
MIAFLSQPWPWYIGGLTFALVMILLAFTGKSFGISGTMRTICAIGGAGKIISFFNFNWKEEMWNIAMAVGALIGGFIAFTFLSNPEPMAIAATTTADLAQMGVSTDFRQLAPPEIFSWTGLFSLKGFLMIVVGGFLVGFGTRYAGGCTSGHAITGLSNLQLPSLIAVIGFFLGGLFATYLILPLIFAL